MGLIRFAMVTVVGALFVAGCAARGPGGDLGHLQVASNVQHGTTGTRVPTQCPKGYIYDGIRCRKQRGIIIDQTKKKPPAPGIILDQTTTIASVTVTKAGQVAKEAMLDQPSNAGSRGPWLSPTGNTAETHDGR